MHKMDAFVEKFLTMPLGYSEGQYGGMRYGVTVSASADGKRRKLYAEALGGKDHVSFNLYLPDSGATHLRPCEMPKEKVIDFVVQYRPLGP